MKLLLGTPWKYLWSYFFPSATKRTPTEVERMLDLLITYPELLNSVYFGESKGCYVDYLIRSNIEEIPNALQNKLRDLVWNHLSNLKTLRLNGNVEGCIFQVGGIGELQTLTTLELDGVSMIPNGTRLLANLTTAYMQDCFHIREGHILELRQVQHLTITYSIRAKMMQRALTPRHRHISLTALQAFRNLKSLCISGRTTIPKTKIFEFFSRPWAGSLFLQKVELSGCGLNENDYYRIQPGLPPALVELVLDYNKIRNLQPFVEHGLPKGVRMISINHNRVDLRRPKQVECVVQLLKDHPSLGSMGSSFTCHSVSPRILYGILYNLRIRPLLEDAWNNGVHVRAWPLLFERATSYTSSRKARKALFGAVNGKRRVYLLKNDDPVGADSFLRIRNRIYARLWITLIYTLLREHPEIVFEHLRLGGQGQRGQQ